MMYIIGQRQKYWIWLLFGVMIKLKKKCFSFMKQENKTRILRTDLLVNFSACSQ